MQNPLNLLAFNNDANHRSLGVAEEIFRLSPRRLEFNKLFEPPPAEHLARNAADTVVFLDYDRIAHWRRAEVEKGDEFGLPAWTREVKYLYLVGLLVKASTEAFQRCVSEIRSDIPRFMHGLPVIPGKPQSAVNLAPAVSEQWHSPR